jgi:predicted 3-demethylubiquinone-9 3-methyltransferase (glyoxalase superfamily)
VADVQGITTFLWFDEQAEEAANHYVSVFKAMGREDSEVTLVSRYGPAASQAAGRPEGSVFTVWFRLDGQEFGSLNGGPMFQFSEAISLMVNCKDQAEIDGFWERLSEGGEEGPCGWLKDRYGLSWQVVPAEMTRMMQQGDPEQQERVMAAVLEMKKLDLATLHQAFDG